jgi:hypothetical protein
VAIANAAPDLTFVVEDLPGTAEQGAQKLDPAYKDRITFVGYDMNDPQPIHGADLYLFRSVFLNWPQGSVVKFLQNLVPALKQGAKILVNEGVLAEPHTLTAWDNKIIRYVAFAHVSVSFEAVMKLNILRGLDTCMLGTFNSSQRTEEEWKHIFALADSRYTFLSIKRPTDFALLWLIEFAWDT